MMQWVKDWNDIIRDVFFRDTVLKSLMLLPEGTNIISFIDKYFIKAGFTDELLTNEPVRIVYSDGGYSDTDVPNIKRKMMTFDIFVKKEHAHNVSNDRLLMRTSAIAERIMYLLTKDRYVAHKGYRFWIAGDWDLGTRTNGYARYCIAFNYLKVY